MSSTTQRPGDEVFDPRCPAGLAIGMGTVALSVTTLVAALLPVPTGVRLGALVVAVGALTVWSGYGRVALGLATIAWPLGNGFLLNHDGTLSWHAGSDFVFIDALLLAAALGMVVALQRSAVARATAAARSAALRDEPAVEYPGPIADLVDLDVLTPGVGEIRIAGSEVQGRDTESGEARHVGPAKLRPRFLPYRFEELLRGRRV